MGKALMGDGSLVLVAGAALIAIVGAATVALGNILYSRPRIDRLRDQNAEQAKQIGLLQADVEKNKSMIGERDNRIRDLVDLATSRPPYDELVASTKALTDATGKIMGMLAAANDPDRATQFRELITKHDDSTRARDELVTQTLTAMKDELKTMGGTLIAVASRLERHSDRRALDI